MRVVRDDIALLAGDAEQNSLRCPALMSGNHMAIPEDVLYGFAEAIKALAARIALIALHNAAH